MGPAQRNQGNWERRAFLYYPFNIYGAAAASATVQRTQPIHGRERNSPVNGCELGQVSTPGPLKAHRGRHCYVGRCWDRDHRLPRPRSLATEARDVTLSKSYTRPATGPPPCQGAGRKWDQPKQEGGTDWLVPLACMLSRFNRVCLFATQWMGFSRARILGWLPCPPPGELPNSGMEPVISCVSCIPAEFFGC